MEWLIDHNHGNTWVIFSSKKLLRKIVPPKDGHNKEAAQMS